MVEAKKKEEEDALKAKFKHNEYTVGKTDKFA
jgi:hypothetical protein